MSTGVGMNDCCLSGKVHEGTPTGVVETIGELNTYVAAPKDGSKAKTIVFLVDVFGWEFKNVRLLADNYAKASFYCYIPDVHKGDSIPLEFLQSVEPPLKTREQLTLLEKTKATASVATTLPPWLIKHREGVSRPLIETLVLERYEILASHGIVDAAYARHPSLVAVPGDFNPVTKPLSLAVGDKDSLLDNDTVGKIQDIMAQKVGVPHELQIYEDQIHGFALRSDWSSAKDQKAMDDSEEQGRDWFNKFLS